MCDKKQCLPKQVLSEEGLHHVSFFYDDFGVTCISNPYTVGKPIFTHIVDNRTKHLPIKPE